MITLRVFHPGRPVVRLSHGGAEGREERWLVFHHRPVNWNAVIGGCLDLMWLSAQPAANGLRLSGDAGTIFWQDRVGCSVLQVQIRAFSPQKRQLILAALRKAARFH
jgi:hypothetical protein